MRALPASFNRDGFTFTQVHAAHPVYVYEQRKGYRRWFEVVKARWMAGRVWKERVFEEGWQYPSSEQWGEAGFTCQSLERAMVKATELKQVVIG